MNCKYCVNNADSFYKNITLDKKLKKKIKKIINITKNLA